MTDAHPIGRVAFALALLSCASCASTPPARAPAPQDSTAARSGGQRIALSPCTVPDLPRPAKCGVARVFEDRALGRGRVIPLRVVVVPAAEPPALPDPVVYIMGGPGGAATTVVPSTMEAFSKSAAKRDFVFVDQRGMATDSPLRCKLADGDDLGTLPGGALPEARLRACLASMDADPSLYTTAVAVDDLDEVLTALGYGAVDVLGESYGSFAAQAFAKAHLGRVRSLVLSGVSSPIGVSPQIRFAASAQAVLDQTFAACAAVAACHAAHPDPASELARAMARLRDRPERIAVDADGKRYQAIVDANGLAMGIRLMLYSAEERAHVIDAIHAAAQGDLEPIELAVVYAGITLTQDLSVGAYLSITCAESLAGVTDEEVRRATASTFLGMSRIGPIRDACKYWPKRPAPPWLHELLRADVPALLVDGTMDAATPVGDLGPIAAALPHSQQVIFPGGGHSLENPCVDAIVASFLDAPLAKVDASCVEPVAPAHSRSSRSCVPTAMSTPSVSMTPGPYSTAEPCVVVGQNASADARAQSKETPYPPPRRPMGPTVLTVLALLGWLVKPSFAKPLVAPTRAKTWPYSPRLPSSTEG
ncbi:MAG TPA: alpha/beta hydrolase [Polyangiaceae bacterium]